MLEGREGLRTSKGVKLSEHIKAYTTYTEQTNRTSYKDAAVLERFLAEIGDRRMSEVSPFHLEQWKSARVKQVSQSTVNRELNIVRGCFSRAVDWKPVTVSPARGVKPYRVDNVRLRILTDREAMIVLLACTPDLRLLARTTLESLMRLSEVLGLRVDDIGPNYATIVQSKNGSSRRVPLTADLRDALILRSQGRGCVFGAGEADIPMTAAAASVAYARLMKRLKLAGVSHHTFRHTGASNMLRDGASPRAVQLIGGWTTLRMVERYCHVTDDELHKAVRLASTHATGTTAGTVNVEDESSETSQTA